MRGASYVWCSIVKSVDKLRDGFGPCLGVGQSLILLVLQLVRFLAYLSRCEFCAY